MSASTREKSVVHTQSKKTKYLNYIIIFSSLIGIILSFYALHVEISKENDPSYVALCDLGSSVSCSKVFTSRYGKGFGLIGRILSEDSSLNQPNCILGVIFYSIVITLSLLKNPSATVIQLVLCITANFGTIYLACILYFILHDFCVVCFATYVVNGVLLVCAIIKYRTIKSMSVTTKQKRK